jgi:DinB superfamily
MGTTSDRRLDGIASVTIPLVDSEEEGAGGMKETAAQYVQRILGHVAGQDPLKVQAATPKKLERLVGGASAAKLRKKPAPDKWSVREILAHLADVEIVVGWRVRSILGAPGAPIQAFDQDSWVEAGHYRERNPRECIAQISAVRKANLALYKSLSPEQWTHHGMHSERGQETVEQIVRMIAGHDLNHLQQIESILAAKKTNS